MTSVSGQGDTHWWCSSGSSFTAAPHQVAGHLFERGKIGSLVCDSGYFYKPLQRGPRGMRERAFYESLNGAHAAEDAEEGDEESTSILDDLSSFVPGFFGVLELGGITYMKMKDVTRQYEEPCIIDIKIGYQTWYPSATDSHIEKCKLKDSATTSSELGFKICGMQVYNCESDSYWRTTKEWCKKLDVNSVKEALVQFLSHPSGNVTIKDICFGPAGLIPKIESLVQWCEKQRHFHFYSASILICYEGNATCPDELKVELKLIDFAHALLANGNKDDNFISGLSSFRVVLEDIASKSS
mmetsp:Transcript_10517/g.19778  ORF Transcript_10517/g.19778 Transcript_10517/m.19778 type:complete len:298 (+) Transcript_10517:392-1285(+)|eukprot:CAMPEP_0197477072 /NCGR_PEP_ID=MMETSP1309-20131121/13461_1 /TAXON_ID=464262 /ORGANISM="Genus nov. species nov., Strain RCC998" /LENGTH=297 /DNA_ID=CAMNT_0043017815 /DNA_START=306 /DNA_END=1199 /DNA_ORIENTATION=+